METVLIIFDSVSEKIFSNSFLFPKNFRPTNSIFENRSGIRKVFVPFSSLGTRTREYPHKQKKCKLLILLLLEVPLINVTTMYFRERTFLSRF